jgi:hypothetical protein
MGIHGRIRININPSPDSLHPVPEHNNERNNTPTDEVGYCHQGNVILSGIVILRNEGSAVLLKADPSFLRMTTPESIKNITLSVYSVYSVVKKLLNAPARGI